MSSDVRVDADIFERLYIKTVVGPDGARMVNAGHLPRPEEKVLAIMGEPSFAVRLADPVSEEGDIPPELRAALDRVVDRLFADWSASEDGAAGQGPVEGVFGPTVHDGAVVIGLETDGLGAGRDVVDAMVRVFVEELTPLEMRLEITSGS